MKPSSLDPARRAWLRRGLALPTAAALAGCGAGTGPVAPAATRSWRMGASALPPRVNLNDVLRTIDLFSQRAELAIVHEELPWTDLLAGMSADAILLRDKTNLVALYRSKGLQLVFMADLTDGLAREREAPQLRALGRSIAEHAVQQVYRNYIEAVVRLLRPEYLGLAAETNLIRVAAPTLYPSVRQAANLAAADVLASGAVTTLFVSVQVEIAWGRLVGAGPYVGIATDRIDFAFAQMIGLSSYPNFGDTQPEDIPADYYSRLPLGAPQLPVMVVEGGWPSLGVSDNG